MLGSVVTVEPSLLIAALPAVRNAVQEPRTAVPVVRTLPMARNQSPIRLRLAGRLRKGRRPPREEPRRMLARPSGCSIRRPGPNRLKSRG
jgi:hypothetical protein